MKYKTIGNCPWCDAELSGKGYSTGWAGSLEMFEDYKLRHEVNHPENKPAEGLGEIK